VKEISNCPAVLKKKALTVLQSKKESPDYSAVAEKEISDCPAV